MTTHRKVAVWIGACLMIASVVYPPWLYVFTENHGHTYPAGWRWIFDPPPVRGEVVAGIDLTRIALEWIGVLAFSCGLFFALPSFSMRWPAKEAKTRNEKIDSIGVVVLAAIAIPGIGYYVITSVQKDHTSIWIFAVVALVMGGPALWDKIWPSKK